MSKLITYLQKFPKTFWSANTMELFERWAWYGIYNILALYLTASTDEGGLGFTQVDKGNLMALIPFILYFLPIITGAIADKFGYRRTLIVAYTVLGSGYYLLGSVSTYSAVFVAFMYVALGAALFKPIISASISRTTNSETSSIGFGIFYMMVNIGGFLGPLASAKLIEIDWNYAFLASSSAIIVNMLIVIFLFKEPVNERNTDSIGKAIITIFRNIFTALRDLKLAVLLMLIVGFWTVFMQLYVTLPVFIEQWIDTTPLYRLIHNVSPTLAALVGTAEGTVSPVMIMNLDALIIVVFQIFVSSFVMRFRPINAMIGGILVNGIGVFLWFVSGNIFFILIGLVVFGFGEMASSPKFTEYIGLIAPRDKVALYMGCSFLPVAFGNLFSGLISGHVYQATSDKLALLKQEVMKRNLTIPDISPNFSKNDYLNQAAQQMNMTQSDLTTFLWENYHPSQFWYLLAVISTLTIVGLLAYDRWIMKGKDMEKE